MASDGFCADGVKVKIRWVRSRELGKVLAVQATAVRSEAAPHR